MTFEEFVNELLASKILDKSNFDNTYVFVSWLGIELIEEEFGYIKATGSLEPNFKSLEQILLKYNKDISFVKYKEFVEDYIIIECSLHNKKCQYITKKFKLKHIYDFFIKERIFQL